MNDQKIEISKTGFQVVCQKVLKEMDDRAKDGIFKDIFDESVKAYINNLTCILFG